ncbi:MAG TPA: SH3 domain-containing protein [Microlunatus sp.]
MNEHRPRRGIRPALAVRAAGIGLAIAGLATGTAVAVWPDHSQTAEPAVQPSAAVRTDLRADRANRDSSRPALATVPAGLDAAEQPPLRKLVADTQEAEAAQRAKEKKAAAKAAAAKVAAAKAKQEAKEKKLRAERRAAAKKAAAKRAAELAALAKPGDVIGRKYAETSANVRIGPGTSYSTVTTLDAGDRVRITDRRDDGWRQVTVNGNGRWILAELLTSTKPEPADSGSSGATEDSSGSSSSGGISSAPCASGSSVENGLTPDAIKVHRAICANFPQVSSYGGVRPDSLPEHPSGRALDAMISDSSVGWEIANWVRAHRQELGVSQVLYAQHIWTVQRSSEGWRSFPDRGSATANHYDHVHVTVYGNAAS